MTVTKKKISYFLLSLFLTLKIAGLHSIAHHIDEVDADIEHCEICTITNAVNFIPALCAEETINSVSSNLVLMQKQNCSFTNSVYTKSHYLHSLFTRPPPFI